MVEEASKEGSQERWPLAEVCSSPGPSFLRNLPTPWKPLRSCADALALRLLRTLPTVNAPKEHTSRESQKLHFSRKDKLFKQKLAGHHSAGLGLRINIEEVLGPNARAYERACKNSVLATARTNTAGFLLVLRTFSVAPDLPRRSDAVDFGLGAHLARTDTGKTRNPNPLRLYSKARSCQS